jgi:tetratricopeptide (TPR) repeat protein
MTVNRTLERRPRAARALLFGALLSCIAFPALSAPADDVKALFERGQARQAWELGRKTPGELGKPAFDYFFGLAAIDAGEPTDGVLALERYLLNNPGSVVARLELGRGYFMLGDTARAREMFDEVLRLNPPVEVRGRIERMLAAIREKESAFKTSFSGFFEGTYGHDSNANSGIGQDSITLPLFGTLQLAQDGRETSDRFHGIALGGQVNVPLKPGIALFAGAQLDSRNFDEVGQFDQRTTGGAAGLSLTRDPNQFRFSFSGNQLRVQSRKYRSLQAYTFEWNRSLDAKRGFSVFAQQAKLEYAGNNAVRDADLTSIGAAWRQSFDGNWQPFLNVGVNVGREDNKRNRDDLGRDTFGARAGLGLTLAPRVSAALSLAWQESNYKAFDDFLGAKREDRFFTVEAAVGYALTPVLGARLEVSHATNDSNIALFEYKRNVVAAKLRYDFK